MVKSRSSTTSKRHKNAIAFLDENIKRLEAASFKSALVKDALSYTKAAKSLIGTDRAEALKKSSDINELKYDLAAAYGGVSPQIMSELEDLKKENGQRPLGVPADMWGRIRSGASSRIKALNDKGFSDAEIAGFLYYERLF